MITETHRVTQPFTSGFVWLWTVIMKSKAPGRSQVLVSGFYLKTKLWWMRCFHAGPPSSPLPLMALLAIDLRLSSQVCQVGDQPPGDLAEALQTSGITASCFLLFCLMNCTEKWPGRFKGPCWALFFIFIYLSPCSLHILSLSICFFLSPGLIFTIIKFSLLHFHSFSLPEYCVLAEEASLHLACL